MNTPMAGRVPVTLTRRDLVRLDDAGRVFLVVRGVLDVWCTPAPGARRSFVASIEAGGVLVGGREGFGFDARPRSTADVIQVTVDEFHETIGPEQAWEMLAAWMRTLGTEPGEDTVDVEQALRVTREALQSHGHDQAARRGRRDELLARRLHETLSRSGRILERSAIGPVGPSQSDDLVAACRLIGAIEGFSVSRTRPTEGSVPPLEQIAQSSGFRIRPVALVEGWKQTEGTLLAILGPTDGTSVPIVLTLRGDGKAMVHGTDGRPPSPLDPGDEADLRRTAYQLYRPLARDKTPNASTLLRFALRGTRTDVLAVIVLGALAGALAALTPLLTKTAFGSAIPAGDTGTLAVMALGMVLASVGAWVFGTVQGVAVVRISNRMERSLQPAVWDWVLSLPTQFFRRYAAGDLANRALGIDRIREVLTTTVVTAALALVFSGFSLLTMFEFSGRLAAIAVGLLLLGMAGALANAWRQLRYLTRMVEMDNRLDGMLVQTLHGITKLRVAGAEDRVFTLLADLSADRETTAYRQQHLAALLSSGATGFSAIAYAVILFAASPLGWVQVSPASFLAFNVAFGIVLAATLSVSSQLVAAAPVAPLYRAIRPILQASPDVNRSGSPAPELSGRIDVRGVSFRYGDDDPLALDDVSFTVEPGQFVAVVGPSGSGKSSLVRLLLGFESPLRGKVFFDDHDLTALDARAVRRQMGVVLQQSRLLSGTIHENIIGALDLSMDDAWWAAEQAGVAADIRAMPMGMHTVITAGGGSVSGGQAQRIVIARALASQPRILLMDEATSALDNETQRHVTESLAALGTTRIVVAHRLTTVQDADKILVVDRGRLVEQGDFSSLIEANGLFARLALRQLT